LPSRFAGKLRVVQARRPDARDADRGRRDGGNRKRPIEVANEALDVASGR
jgi:hypothetical protein